MLDTGVPGHLNLTEKVKDYGRSNHPLLVNWRIIMNLCDLWKDAGTQILFFLVPWFLLEAAPGAPGQAVIVSLHDSSPKAPFVVLMSLCSSLPHCVRVGL